MFSKHCMLIVEISPLKNGNWGWKAISTDLADLVCRNCPCEYWRKPGWGCSHGNRKAATRDIGGIISSKVCRCVCVCVWVGACSMVGGVWWRGYSQREGPTFLFNCQVEVMTGGSACYLVWQHYGGISRCWVIFTALQACFICSPDPFNYLKFRGCLTVITVMIS